MYVEKKPSSVLSFRKKEQFSCIFQEYISRSLWTAWNSVPSYILLAGITNDHKVFVNSHLIDLLWENGSPLQKMKKWKTRHTLLFNKVMFNGSLYFCSKLNQWKSSIFLSWKYIDGKCFKNYQKLFMKDFQKSLDKI